MRSAFWLLAAALPGIVSCRVDTTIHDNLPPVVTITAPADGSTVSGSVSIDADVSDDYGVARVRFIVDGTVKSTTYSWPFHYDWSTLGLAPSSVHVITVEAIDEAQNQGTDQISVTVLNGTNAPPAAR
ncbi:MAG TPA: Ig-like domain-containing protein [Gemmatimonadales bacterium]|jgi:leucyl aminopeptidase|nr:Ig-like domain-containing protein [Gemmatimonadales bacterium]